MIFLIDHNIEGQSLMLFGSIISEGWLDTLPIRFVSFVDSLIEIALYIENYLGVSRLFVP
ncbi:MAG: hypothetical protein F6K14_10495 [Symploca sp. SIO2C1]|nr:hypothetical protein [Symploca sp. SIO2C1]